MLWLARELHDIVAHSVSLMVVQAGSDDDGIPNAVMGMWNFITLHG